MAEILPDALKENKCEGLLRLIAGLADGAGRPKSARILRLADVKGDRKKAGEMRVRLRFSVDGCSQNSRPLRIFKSLGVKDLARVVIHHTDSAGLPLSPPLFFGLQARLVHIT